MTDRFVESSRDSRTAHGAVRVASMPPPVALAALDPPLPLLLVGADMDVQWISTAAVEELGVYPAEVVGRSGYEVLPAGRSRRAQHDELLAGRHERLDFPRITLATADGEPRH
jgi:hypothetical protein